MENYDNTYDEQTVAAPQYNENLNEEYCEDHGNSVPHDNASCLDNASCADDYCSDEQAHQDDWRINLPEELHSTPALTKFNDIAALAKAYNEQSSLIGKKVSDFSQADWNTYSEMVGLSNPDGDVPSASSEYPIDTSPYSEGYDNMLSDGEVEYVKGLAYEMGLNKENAQYLYDGINNIFNQMEMEKEELADENYKILADQWGNAIEQKSAAIDECVRSVLPQIAGGNEEYWAEKIQTFGLHKDAAFCNLLANLGELVSESRSTGYSNLAPIDAAARLNQMRSDPQIMGIINNQHHPKNRDLSHEFRSLIQIKNGEW